MIAESNSYIPNIAPSLSVSSSEDNHSDDSESQSTDSDQDIMDIIEYRIEAVKDKIESY